MSDLILVLAVALASGVEMVEALTLVMAGGVTRGFRSTLIGAGAALVILALAVGLLGVGLVRYLPLTAMRVVIGTLLLVYGLAWLRKAVLRASGHKAPHDEDAIYAATVASLSGEGSVRAGIDPAGFLVGFKAVLLEGAEVVVIAIALGAPSHRLGLAALGAGTAVPVVGVAGALMHRQLSRVPENAMKMTVGLLLVTFGSFWAGEGVGVRWPGADLFVLALLAAYAAAAAVLVRGMAAAVPGD